MITTANPGGQGAQTPTNGPNNSILTVASPTSAQFEVGNSPYVVLSPNTDADINVQISDEKGNWGTWYIHGTAVTLSTTNTAVVIKMPGKYRLYYTGGTQANIRWYKVETTQEINDAPPVAISGGGGGGSQTLGLVAPTSISISGGNVIDIASLIIAGQTPLVATDTASIDFTTSGTSGHNLTGSVKISANAGNAASIVADGIFVASGAVSNATEAVTGVVRIATPTQANTGTAHSNATANATGELPVVTTPTPTVSPFDLKTQPALICSNTTGISNLTTSDLRVAINSVLASIDISSTRATVIGCNNTDNVGGNNSTQISCDGTGGFTSIVTGDYALEAACSEVTLSGNYSVALASGGAVGSPVTVSGAAAAAIASAGPSTVSGATAAIIAASNVTASGNASLVAASNTCTATNTYNVVIGSVTSNATTNTNAGVYSSSACNSTAQQSVNLGSASSTASGARSLNAASNTSTNAGVDGVILASVSGSILNTSTEALVAASNLGTIAGVRSAVIGSNNVVVQAAGDGVTVLSSQSIASASGTGTVIIASNTASIAGTNSAIVACNISGAGTGISAGTGNAIVASCASTIVGSNYNFVAASGVSGGTVAISALGGGHNAVLASNTITATSYFSTLASTFNTVDNGTGNLSGALVSGTYSASAATCAGIASSTITFGTTNTNSVSLGSGGITFSNGTTRGVAIASADVSAVQTPLVGGTSCSLISAEDSRVSDTCSVVIGSQGCTVNNGFQVVLASKRVLAAAANYRVVGGYNAAGAPSTANRTWEIDSTNGNVLISGALTPGHVFPDYAEMFPNVHHDENPVGTLVTWDRKLKGVRPALTGERIRGIVSTTSSIVCGDTPISAKKRFIYNEWGAVEKEVVDGIESPKVNPEWDGSLENVPRSKRPKEWTQVALLGQVFVRIDSSVTEDTEFISGEGGIGTHSNKTTNVELQEITLPYDATRGYGIAYCYVH